MKDKNGDEIFGIQHASLQSLDTELYNCYCSGLMSQIYTSPEENCGTTIYSVLNQGQLRIYACL